MSFKLNRIVKQCSIMSSHTSESSQKVNTLINGAHTQYGGSYTYYCGSVTDTIGAKMSTFDSDIFDSSYRSP